MNEYSRIVAGNQAVANELLHRGDVLRVEQVGQKPQPMGGLRSFWVIPDREPVADDLRLALLKGAIQIQGSVCQCNAVSDKRKLMQNHCTVQCEREGAGADAQIRVGKIVQEPPE